MIDSNPGPGQVAGSVRGTRRLIARADTLRRASELRYWRLPGSGRFGTKARKLFQHDLHRAIGSNYSSEGILTRCCNGLIEFAPCNHPARSVIHNIGSQREADTAWLVNKILLEPHYLGVEPQVAGRDAGRQHDPAERAAVLDSGNDKRREHACRRIDPLAVRKILVRMGPSRIDNMRAVKTGCRTRRID